MKVFTCGMSSMQNLQGHTSGFQFFIVIEYFYNSMAIHWTFLLGTKKVAFQM